MNQVLKKILFVAAFVLCTLVLPAIILLLFVDSTSGFAVYVITFAVILFAILGYIVMSIHTTSKEINKAVEDMKLQNAAIAYKLTGGLSEKQIEETPVEVQEEQKEVQEKPKKVNLNPDDPLDFK